MQRCKFISTGRPRPPVLGQGYLLLKAGSPGGRPKNTISQLLINCNRPTELYNHSICSGNCQVNPLKASVFSIFLPITTQNDHPLSIRAINIWSGLPNFWGRSPTGLWADFNEFAMLIFALYWTKDYNLSPMVDFEKIERLTPLSLVWQAANKDGQAVNQDSLLGN